ncbi:nucleotidyltransferase domain-containing protein [Robertmurraya korlensis]|uniref:nucleotidyltransferase domain-containing protein n=1 Tax=Robertmurraya korlensis TaxID=519977 RepID=UPI0008241238|nr:nucleotidyltransferase family protein [Robertmurraya korlensis]
MNWMEALYEPEIPLDSSDYKSLLKEIMEFGVVPQVYYLLKQQGKLEQTPVFFQERLKEQYEESLFLSLFIRSQLTKVLDCFEERELPAIPLKGVHFAEKYFGHIGARGTSDIDLLIHPEDLNKAISLVTSLGFTVEEEPIEGHFHCSFSRHIPNARIPLTVELHWNLLKNDTCKLPIEEFWQNAKRLGNYQHIFELNDYHTFYMICLHGWRHNLDSPKHFLDIIQLIYRIGEQVDYITLFNQARQHRTQKRMIRTLAIVYQQHPYLQKVKPLPVRRPNFWDYKAFKNGHKKQLKNYLDFIDYSFFSYDSISHSKNEFFNWMKSFRPTQTTFHNF